MYMPQRHDPFARDLLTEWVSFHDAEPLNTNSEGGNLAQKIAKVSATFE